MFSRILISKKKNKKKLKVLYDFVIHHKPDNNDFISARNARLRKFKIICPFVFSWFGITPPLNELLFGNSKTFLKDRGV